MGPLGNSSINGRGCIAGDTAAFRTGSWSSEEQHSYQRTRLRRGSALPSCSSTDKSILAGRAGGCAGCSTVRWSLRFCRTGHGCCQPVPTRKLRLKVNEAKSAVERGQAAHSAEGPRQVQGADPGYDMPASGRQSAAVDQGAEPYLIGCAATSALPGAWVRRRLRMYLWRQ